MENNERIEVNYKNKKRYKTAKYPIRQSAFFTWLIKFLSKIMLIGKKYKIEKVNMDNLKPPYIMLSNHMYFIDFELVALATYPHKMNNVVNIDGYYRRPWLMTWIGSICTRKFTNDLHLIKSIMKVVKRGDVLGMYPEARYSPMGTTAYIPDSVAKLVKKCKAPVVVVIHHGNHLHTPFWNFRKKRKVPLYTRATQVLTKEQVEQMSVEEIDKVIKEAFVYDDYKYQLERRKEVSIYMPRENKISATMIRKEPYKYWDKIVPTFRKVFVHNILITGTASEGKSTLVSDLGKYFNTTLSVEYGRFALEDNKTKETDLNVDDYMKYLSNQYNLTCEQILNANKVFLGDTDNLVTMMYAKYYSTDSDFKLSVDDYKKIEIEGMKYNKFYHWNKIYLISPTNKFVDDGIRYMKHSDLTIRNELFLILCDLLKKANLWEKVEILDGNYYENFIKIKEYINEVIL